MHNQLAVTVVVGSCLAAGTILWAGSYPSGALMPELAAVLLAGITSVLWLVFLVAGLRARRFRLLGMITAVGVVVLVGSAFAARIELPLLARFAIVRPAFDRIVAERAAVGTGQKPCPAWIGTYRISACWTYGTGTYFSERDGGFLNGVGFAYLPDGPPDGSPVGGSITYSQLRGSWYWYIQEW